MNNTSMKHAVSAILCEVERISNRCDPTVLNLYVHVGDDRKTHMTLLSALEMAADAYQSMYVCRYPEEQGGEIEDVWMTRETFLPFILANNFDVRTH